MPRKDRAPIASRGEYGPRVWRLSLQEPQTGRRHDFDDLDSMIAYLHERIDALPQAEKEPAPAHPRQVENRMRIARLRRFMARFGQAQQT